MDPFAPFLMPDQPFRFRLNLLRWGLQSRGNKTRKDLLGLATYWGKGRSLYHRTSGALLTREETYSSSMAEAGGSDLTIAWEQRS